MLAGAGGPATLNGGSMEGHLGRESEVEQVSPPAHDEGNLEVTS